MRKGMVLLVGFALAIYCAATAQDTLKPQAGEKGKKDQKQGEQKIESQKSDSAYQLPWLSEVPPSIAEAWGTGKGLTPEDCVIIGNVIEVKGTPDDDYYFTQIRVAVEQVVTGKLEREQEKEVLLKMVSGTVSQERLKRTGIREMYLNYPKGIGLVETNPDLEELYNIKVGTRIALHLTKYPWDLHQLYFGNKNLLPTGRNITSIQRCSGYYEPLASWLVRGDSVVCGYNNKRVSLKEWIRDEKKRW